jgi:hypothetical protein
MTTTINFPLDFTLEAREETPILEENKKSAFDGRRYGEFDPSRPIPKTIHQIWINKNNEIPLSYEKKWRDSWKKKMPNWNFKIWYKDDVEKLFKEKYPVSYKKYKSYHIPVCRADIARLAILHSEGGLYVDLDFECLKPIDEWIENKNALLVAYDVDKVRETFLKNSIMGACPGHPYFLETLKNLKKSLVPENFDWDNTFSKRQARLSGQISEMEKKETKMLSRKSLNKRRGTLEKLKKELANLEPKTIADKKLAIETRKGRNGFVFFRTGPRFFGKQLKEYDFKKTSLSLIPLKPFFPYEGGNRFKMKDKSTFNEEVYGVHRYTFFWSS